MHWKILRDPYLAPLCRKHGEEAAWAAGFFLDDDPEDAPLDDTEWLCTPRPKVPVAGERPAVLLSTGGFHPVHAGHLQMMASARVAAERAGFDVVGGYLSPGHDSYLRMKCGPATIPAQQRLKEAAAATAESDWLSVDPWEAMHCRVAVNYTDVTARLEGYLRRHVDHRLEVIYVCGADNARFAYAFTERGRCIVVGRPGAEPELQKWHTRLAEHSRIIWVEGCHPAASRHLRSIPTKPVARPRLVVRLEDDRAVRTLRLEGVREFQSSLLALLARHAEVRTAPLIDPDPEPNVISLDAMLPAEHNFAISRVFAPGGYQALGHVPRPFSASFGEQIARIPPGTYSLRDDDRVTGDTMKRVVALLPPGVTIDRTTVALEHGDGEDIVDARDFLLGADDGGLVLALPQGGVGRAPYLLPYVDPSARSSIARSHVFSIEVWELNARTFARTNLRIRDLPAPARATFQFPEDMRLEDLCAWHAGRLRRIVELSKGA